MASLRQQFAVADGGLIVLLIGKDSGVKLRSDRPLTAEQIFTTIDRMPMRQQERSADDNHRDTDTRTRAAVADATHGRPARLNGRIFIDVTPNCQTRPTMLDQLCKDDDERRYHQR